MMGFPVIPFKLCDFWSILHESMNGDTLTVSGALPGGDSVVATFKKQSAPKGSWIAATLKARK
jgi:hypothetical protein